MKTERLLQMYEGAFEDWKLRLAVSRIRALGFPKHEWGELMQGLCVLMLEFKYDPEHTKGAKEDTVLFAVINRHLLSVMRQRYRDQKVFARYLRSLGIRDDGSSVAQEPAMELDIPLQMDVRKAVSELSEFDQAVCEELTATAERSQIARRLDCDWHTVDKAIGRIREHFQARGLDAEVLS